MGELIETHSECPECGSSDALAVYTDHTYCFSCEKYTKLTEGNTMPPTTKSKAVTPAKKAVSKQTFDRLKVVELVERRLSLQTCQKFNYGQDSQGRQVAPYYKEGQLVALKTRYPDKTFSWQGDTKDPQLFGQQVFNKGPVLIITEGEIDALSVYQATKLPAVSLPNGAGGAVKSILSNIEYVEGFDKVVFAFDNDMPGKKALSQVAPQVSPGKAYIAQFPDDAKDANDLIKSGRTAELRDVIKNAAAYRPDGVVSGGGCWKELNAPIKAGYSLPWETLSKLTYGIRKSEFWVLGGGTGIGKTSFFKEMEAHLLLEEGLTVGVIHLEESLKDTRLGLMAKYGQEAYYLPNVEVDEEKKKEAYENVCNSGRLYLYDSFGACDFATIASRIRYMVQGCGCDVVFLDHLTALIDGESGDVNQKMRNIVSGLAALTRNLDFTLVAISHLRKADSTPHEEGGRVCLDHFYGSSAIKQWANFIFGIERNQQDPDPTKRHTSNIRCLKDRLTGQAAGEIVSVFYDKATTKLTECRSEYLDEDALMKNFESAGEGKEFI